MKALSVKNPWAALIASGRKTIEVRSWRTHYRGALVIVSTQRPDLTGHHRALASSAPNSVSMCVVDIVDCVRGERSHKRHTGGIDPTGSWCWVLANRRPIGQVAVKGRLGLWDWPG